MAVPGTLAEVGSGTTLLVTGSCGLRCGDPGDHRDDKQAPRDRFVWPDRFRSGVSPCPPWLAGVRDCPAQLRHCRQLPFDEIDVNAVGVLNTRIATRCPS